MTNARKYGFTLTGLTPLLMHNDNIEWANRMEAWKNDPQNRKKSVAGDDRSPAFRWIGSLYHDGKMLCIPSDNLMAALREAGTAVPVPGGKGGKTFKAQTQSGILVNEAFLLLTAGDGTIAVEDVVALDGVEEFDRHQARVHELGFALFCKRARIGVGRRATKNLRVRPRFEKWSVSGTMTVFDDQITTEILSMILAVAGKYKGLCDWRPGSPTPGPFGMFEAAIKAA